ncbi:MAG: zf-HC2 domain-containing protein [Chloroflexota bacterium]
MNHERMYVLMNRALDGELSVEEGYQLKNHLAECQECAVQWESLQSLDALLSNTELVPAPLSLRRRVSVQVLHRAPKRSFAKLLATLTASAAAALGVTPAVAVVGYGLWITFRSPTEIGDLVLWIKKLLETRSILFQALIDVGVISTKSLITDHQQILLAIISICGALGAGLLFWWLQRPRTILVQG